MPLGPQCTLHASTDRKYMLCTLCLPVFLAPEGAVTPCPSVPNESFCDGVEDLVGFWTRLGRVLPRLMVTLFVVWAAEAAVPPAGL